MPSENILRCVSFCFFFHSIGFLHILRHNNRNDYNSVFLGVFSAPSLSLSLSFPFLTNWIKYETEKAILTILASFTMWITWHMHLPFNKHTRHTWLSKINSYFRALIDCLVFYVERLTKKGKCNATFFLTSFIWPAK